MRLGLAKAHRGIPKTSSFQRVSPCDVAIFWLLGWRCRSSAAGCRITRSGTALAQDKGAPFEAATVRALARELAQKPYKAPDNKLPDALKDLTYDRYRMIRFKPEQALWRDEGLPFQLQFFHRGFYYANRVDIFEVKDGRRHPDRLFARHVHLRRPAGAGHQDQSRLRGLPHPRADQPAGLFRRDRRVSRRELFPRGRQGPDLRPLGARAFAQDRRPEGRGISQLPHLLGRAARQGRKLDRGACAARQRERGGRLSLHHPARARPRSTTSRRRCFRACRSSRSGSRRSPACISSAPTIAAASTISAPRCTTPTALRSRTAAASRLWRPLNNPADLQVSAFVDNNPRGFGLMQRQRDFRAYEDLEARYERRPSAFVEPIGDWGEGAVHLVEIPTTTEINDNIVAFWRPRAPTRAKGEYVYTYRIHWGAQLPKPLPLAQVVATRIGAGPEESRLIVIDFAGENLKGVPPADIKAHGLVRQGQGAQRRDATQSARSAARGCTSSCCRAAKRRSSCARSSSAARIRSRKSGCTDGRREAGYAAPRQSRHARICPPKRRSRCRCSRCARASAPRRLPIAPGSIAARRAFVFGTALALSVLAAYEMYLVLAVGGLTTLETVILGLFVDPVRLDRAVVRQHARRRRSRC